MQPDPRSLGATSVREPDEGPAVAIVVLNWNRWAATTTCLESLAATTYERRRVIVVDNGSTDPPARADAIALDADDFLQTGENLGYAGGNNVGLRRAIEGGADFVWIVNNDVVVDRQALAELVQIAMSNERVGVLTTNVQSSDGRFDRDVAFSGSPENAPWDYFGEFQYVECDGCAAGFHATEGVRGPSLFFKVAALEESGLLDERYFHYYEEVDLVERLRRLGWTSGLACRARIAHASGTTLSYETGQSIYYLFRNFLLLRHKLYGETLLSTLARHPLQLPRHLFAARHTFRGELRPIRAHLLALVDGARGKHGRRALGAAFQERLSFDR